MPMKKNGIETYRCGEQGYHPFLIREGWQVAQLNYMRDQDLYGIEKMDVHLKTDEVFILLKGTAVLIAAMEENNDFRFECIRMDTGIAYNIPVFHWHNIAMGEDAELFIVERDNTHLGDYEFRKLTVEQQKRLNAQIKELIERQE
jgi:mannose-6-phosphate isomerase-like protein (cupin superfamily)